MIPSEANVAAVMTMLPIVVEAGLTLEAAAQIMARHSFRHLPVVDQGRLVGLVSQRDLLAAGDPHALVGEVMTENLVAVHSQSSACEAARLLLNLKVGCLPVINDGKLVGIVTETDFVRVAYAVLSAVSSSVASARKADGAAHALKGNGAAHALKRNGAAHAPKGNGAAHAPKGRSPKHTPTTKPHKPPARPKAKAARAHK